MKTPVRIFRPLALPSPAEALRSEVRELLAPCIRHEQLEFVELLPGDLQAAQDTLTTAVAWGWSAEVNHRLETGDVRIVLFRTTPLGMIRAKVAAPTIVAALAGLEDLLLAAIAKAEATRGASTERRAA